MNGLESFKPLLTALILPPVPWLVLLLFGGWLAGVRRRLGLAVVVLGTALLWSSTCAGTAAWLQGHLLAIHPPLSQDEIAALKPPRGQVAATTAIVVLGAGRISRAPESGASELRPVSMERLRYGLRLARETGLPVAFSGGIGWAAREDGGQSEAEIAQRVAERDFQRPIKWAESNSRDTRENAIYTVKLLNAAGIKHIVLVTNAWHMPRAQRNFREAAGDSIRITAAPMGYIVADGRGLLDWFPSNDGSQAVRDVLREALALLVRA